MEMNELWKMFEVLSPDDLMAICGVCDDFEAMVLNMALSYLLPLHRTSIASPNISNNPPKHVICCTFCITMHMWSTFDVHTTDGCVNYPTKDYRTGRFLICEGTLYLAGNGLLWATPDFTAEIHKINITLQITGGRGPNFGSWHFWFFLIFGISEFLKQYCVSNGIPLWMLPVLYL